MMKNQSKTTYCLIVKISDLRDFCRKNKYFLVEEFNPNIDKTLVKLMTEHYYNGQNNNNLWIKNSISLNSYNIGIRENDSTDIKFFFRGKPFITTGELPINFEFCDFFIHSQIPFSFLVQENTDESYPINIPIHQLCCNHMSYEE